MSGPAGQSLVATLTWPRGLESAAVSLRVHIVLVGYLLVILVKHAVTAQEYSWRTYHLWLGRGISRPVVTCRKMCGCVDCNLAWSLITAVIVSSLVTGILTLVVKGSTALSAGQLWAFFLEYSHHFL